MARLTKNQVSPDSGLTTHVFVDCRYAIFASVLIKEERNSLWG